MIWIEKIFLSPIWRLAVLLFCLLFCCFQNSKTASMSRHWSWCTILTKCPDTMICMWHTNVLTCSSPCAACSGHLLFCCFDQNSSPRAKQQPDNTPKTCEHKIWPQIHQSDDGIWLGFQGELPTPNRHKMTAVAPLHFFGRFGADRYRGMSSAFKGVWATVLNKEAWSGRQMWSQNGISISGLTTSR